MEVNEASQIYDQFKNSKFQTLVKSLLKNAIQYSKLRVDWFLADKDDLAEIDKSRTISHNSFISSCDALARNMKQNGEDYTWRTKLGDDRKEIGDFAVMLVAVLGIKAR